MFSGAFTNADKAALGLDADALVGGLANFVLPAGTFNVNLKATAAQSSLASAAGATIGTLDANVAAGKNGLSLKDGVVVNGYKKTAGDVSLNGGAIVAISTAADVAADAKDKGIKISDGVFVKSVIATGDITVDAKGYKLPLDKITIAEGKTVTLKNSTGAIADDGWNGQPYVAEIAGLGDTGANIKVVSPDALKNMTSVSNVNIDATGATEMVAGVSTVTGKLNVTKDIFTKTKFTATKVVLSAATMTGSTFASPIEINVDAVDKSYTFTAVDFGTNQITMNKTAKKSIGTSDTKWYQYNASTGKWENVADESKISAANKTLQPDAITFTTDWQLFVDATDQPSTELAKKLAGKYWFSITTNYTADIANADMHTVVAFDSKCKYSSKALEPATLSKVFVTTSLAEWFQPMFNGVQLKWYKSGTDWVAGAVN